MEAKAARRVEGLWGYTAQQLGSQATSLGPTLFLLIESIDSSQEGTDHWLPESPPRTDGRWELNTLFLDYTNHFGCFGFSQITQLAC